MPTNSNEILVTGGAGFIGAHMALTLLEAGFHPIVLDRKLINDLPESITSIQGDISNRSFHLAVLITDVKRIKTDLSWQPNYPDLESIIRHAWDFAQKKNKESSCQLSLD